MSVAGECVAVAGPGVPGGGGRCAGQGGDMPGYDFIRYARGKLDSLGTVQVFFPDLGEYLVMLVVLHFLSL